MNKIYRALSCLFLMVIVFPGFAELFHDSPAVSFVGPIEKKPGSDVQVRLDKVLANVIPSSTGHTSSASGIALYFLWCLPSGGACTSNAETPIPEVNKIARVSSCEKNLPFNELINCLHSQVSAGLYTAKVPSITYGGVTYPRGKVCLRYLYNLDSTNGIGVFSFANSDNACYLSPNTIDWCSLVTPTVNFEFGPLVSSKAQGSSIEKNISIYCTGAVSYQLSLAGNIDSSINLENGMHVDFSLDGQGLNHTLSSSDEGVTSHKLTATLNGTPNSTGVFNASGVLYVTYP